MWVVHGLVYVFWVVWIIDVWGSLNDTVFDILVSCWVSGIY